MKHPFGSEGETESPRRLGRGMIVVAWLLALGLLTWLFDGWLDGQRNPNRHVKSMFSDGTTVVTLERNRYGHYNATGKINGREVEFMIDTGATIVSVPAILAKHLKLQNGPAVLTSTANGTVMTYQTRLHSVRLGNIELRDVDANINPHTQNEEVLLGMSFLKHLEFTQRGRMLLLKQQEK